MNAYAPCGACRALVPIDTGCQHWKPRRAPAPVLLDNRTDTLITAETLREPHGGHAPISRIVALRGAELQRQMLTEALADPDGIVTANGVTSRRNALTKMLRQGYVERIGRRNDRYDPIRYRITPIGRAVMTEYARAYPDNALLPQLPAKVTSS